MGYRDPGRQGVASFRYGGTPLRDISGKAIKAVTLATERNTNR